MKIKLLVFTVLIAMAFSSCQQKSKEVAKTETTETDSLGRYLYLANSGVLHSENTCYKMIVDKDEKGHDVVGYQFIDTMTVYELSCLFCSNCFNDAKYEHLKKIQKRNFNAKRLYEALTADGADIGDNFEDFAHKFYTNDAEGVPRSKRVYEFLKEEGAITSPTYEAFMEKLNGFDL